MAGVFIETEEVVEGRKVRFADRPITFGQFVEMGHPKRWEELVGGVIVEKPMVQLDHELCSGWLYQVIGPYVKKRGLGLMLSSRILVEMGEFGGRMPDLLFVRQERMDIVQQRAVYGAPDLIIEVVSLNDRPSDLRALEADYRTLDVPEVVFIDPRKETIRILRKQGETYTEQSLTTGDVRFEALDGFTLQADWILHEPRPDVFDTLTALLAVSPGE